MVILSPSPIPLSEPGPSSGFGRFNRRDPLLEMYSVERWIG
jgi:hypothetical protein